MFTPPSGINLEHLLASLAQIRRPTARGGRQGIAGSLRPHTEAASRPVTAQLGVSPSQRTMPAAVLFAHGPGNSQASAAESYAPVNAGAVAAGTAAPMYAPRAAQTSGGVDQVSPILQALLRGGKLAL